jgi:hypothetical protein
MAAVAAYYLQELAPPEERKREVDVQDIVEYFKQAGFPLPTATKQILLNAKAAGYFKAVGGGKFRRYAWCSRSVTLSSSRSLPWSLRQVPGMGDSPPVP